MKSSRYTRRRHSRLSSPGINCILAVRRRFSSFSAACWRSWRAASLPNASMASRIAYFRSSLTPKACLWAFSSSDSNRLAPCVWSQTFAVQQGGRGLQG